MMLARPPAREGEPACDGGCERHPRLRVVLWLLWLAVALGLALFAGHGLARASAPVTVDLQPRQLTPRVWYVQGDSGPVSLQNQGFNSNAGFVVTDEGVVVFDTLGTPALGAALLAQIRRITDKPVRHVVISHYHADHYYGLQAFKAAGAEIIAHRRARDYLASEAPAARLAERRQSLAPWVTADARIVAPDRYVDGDASLRLGGVDFRLYPVGPAHTAEDLMMLVEQDDVLFVGDLVFAGRLPFVGDADARGWLVVLEQLGARNPRVVVGGHGAASYDASRDLALTRDYLRLLVQEMRRAADELLDFDEAYARTDWSRFAALPAFEATNRRNAYSVYLQMQREALGSR